MEAFFTPGIFPLHCRSLRNPAKQTASSCILTSSRNMTSTTYPQHIPSVPYSDSKSSLQTLDIWLPRPLDQSDPEKSLWIMYHPSLQPPTNPANDIPATSTAAPGATPCKPPPALNPPSNKSYPTHPLPSPASHPSTTAYRRTPRTPQPHPRPLTPTEMSRTPRISRTWRPASLSCSANIMSRDG
jgi:hypothetical protein